MSQAPMTRAAAVQAQRTAKPDQGASELAGGWTLRIACPAWLGRYLAMSGPHGLGSAVMMLGATRTSPTKAAMAPAVRRQMPPRPRAKRARTVKKRPPPTTARSTPGSLSDTPACLLARMAWPLRKAANDAADPTTNTGIASTTAFAAKT